MNVRVLVPKAANQITQAQKLACNKFSFNKVCFKLKMSEFEIKACDCRRLEKKIKDKNNKKKPKTLG